MNARGRRVELRAAERRDREVTVMAVPEAVRALAPRPPRRLPCLVDPECTVDHLHRKPRRRPIREDLT